MAKKREYFKNDVDLQGVYANNTLGTSEQVLKTNGSTAYWDNPGTWKVVAVSASPTTITGVIVETIIKTIVIPGGVMGPNGVLRITYIGTNTNSANVKTVRMRIGAAGSGLGGTAIVNYATTNQLSFNSIRQIFNRNSQSSQITSTSGTTTGFGVGTGVNTTTSIDTSVDWEINITGNPTNAGDSMGIETYLVEVFYKE